jgi:hypothetical protein
MSVTCFDLQFWRSTVMTIMSTKRKDKNAWGIQSMETYLTSIMIWKKRHCNFDDEKNSLCVYVRYDYTE